MSITALFTNNRTQAIRLTAALRLPEDVKKAQGHARRGDRIIWPVGDSQAPFYELSEFARVPGWMVESRVGSLNGGPTS